MTSAPAPRRELLATTTATGADGTVLCLAVRGFLDYDSSEQFLDDVTAHLSTTPGVRTLRVDCAALGGIDSMGLSILLMLRRRTAAAGVSLHLDHRSEALDRVLEVTGTLDHFASDRTGEAASAAETDRDPRGPHAGS